MKKRFMPLCFVLVVSFLFLTGCQNKLKELPEDPVIFETGELNIQDEDTGYRTIEYNDKVYIIYGGIKAKGLLRNISYAYGECLGYVEDDQSDRIYALAGESTDEWLIENHIEGFMENPAILREITTKDNEEIPESVKSFEYDYWKQQIGMPWDCRLVTGGFQ